MIRKATNEQIKFYENVLYPLQDIVLSDNNILPFYLTGGTALSRYYYQHRYSDDLDFFCDGLKYSNQDFLGFCQKLIYSLESKFDNIEITINGELYKRLFVVKQNVRLKIEFVYEAYKTIKEKKIMNTFYLDTKENICTNKITAISDRKTLKDYIDLFYLLNDICFEDAVKWAEYKIVPLDYENTIIAFKDTLNNLEGDIVLIKEIEQKELNAFIKNLIKKMIDYAKSRK